MKHDGLESSIEQPSDPTNISNAGINGTNTNAVAINSIVTIVTEPESNAGDAYEKSRSSHEENV